MSGVGQGTHASGTDGQTPIALVVDDDDDVRQLFKAMLDELGWQSVLVLGVVTPRYHDSYLFGRLSGSAKPARIADARY